jgi:carbonic anhydrase
MSSSEIERLFQNNRAWAERKTKQDPEFFEKLSGQQAPKYLWIGCSDARVPANEVVGLVSGELFVHRNIGNVVVHTDFNALSVIQFAVDVLAVRHVIVCGHYGCGGVQAAASDTELGLADHWIRHIKDVRDRNERVLSAIEDEGRRIARLCELNVVSQVRNVCALPVIQDAWLRGHTLTIHGFIYGLQDGILRDLHVSISNEEALDRMIGDNPGTEREGTVIVP